MATLEEYMERQCSFCLTHGTTWSDQTGAIIKVRTCIEMQSEARFLIFYVPSAPDSYGRIYSLIANSQKAYDQSTDIQVKIGFVGDVRAGAEKEFFTRRVYVYHEDSLGASEIANIDALGKTLDISITLRGQEYVDGMNKVEKPLAFISHDSRDKQEVALPIAMGLQKRFCSVWYDEFSLKVGQSLRESIERGLKEAKKCIVVLSPNFLSNSGWTKVEFNSIFTKSMLDDGNIILPVWHNVTVRDVFEYSPALADKFGLMWSKGEDYVIGSLHRAVLDIEPR